MVVMDLEVIEDWIGTILVWGFGKGINSCMLCIAMAMRHIYFDVEGILVARN